MDQLTFLKIDEVHCKADQIFRSGFMGIKLVDP